MPPQVAYSDFDWADFEQISNYEVMYRPSGLIFPLTGIRPTDGLLNGVGTGYYWSAVPRVMNYGYYLSVSRSGLILNSIQGRENALSVRPVQE